MKKLAALARSIEARAALILLLSILAIQAGEFWLYRQSTVAAAEEAFASEVAKQLTLAREAVLRRPRDEREAEARALSSTHFEIGWASSPPNQRPTPASLRNLRDRILRLAPSLGSGLVLSLEEPGSPLHQMEISGAVPLADGSHLTFRSAHAPPRLQDGFWERVSVAMGVLVVLLALALMHWIASPLRHLARATARIGTGESVHLPEVGPDETRGIARALNAMQQRIRGLISERTQALAAVSHDLRTPIARLRLRLDAVPDPEQRASMSSDLDDMQSMIDSTLSYLKGEADPEKRQAVNVASMLMSIADASADASRDVAYEGPGRAVATVRPIGLRRAIENLVDNAVRYGTRARLTLEVRDSVLVIQVDDDGTGLSAEDAQRAFEPFTRIEASRNRNAGGTGLGLTIARRAILSEGGEITLTNRSEGGLRAEITLPRTKTSGT